MSTTGPISKLTPPEFKLPWLPIAVRIEWCLIAGIDVLFVQLSPAIASLRLVIKWGYT